MDNDSKLIHMFQSCESISIQELRAGDFLLHTFSKIGEIASLDAYLEGCRLPSDSFFWDTRSTKIEGSGISFGGNKKQQDVIIEFKRILSEQYQLTPDEVVKQWEIMEDNYEGFQIVHWDFADNPSQFIIFIDGMPRKEVEEINQQRKIDFEKWKVEYCNQVERVEKIIK